MRLAEKLVVFLLRPIYRTFFERLVWWFLTRIKEFFFSEVNASLADITARLDRIERGEGGPQAAFESVSAAHWGVVERLILSLLRQPESLVPNHTAGWQEPAAGSFETDPVHSNGPTNVR